MKAILIKQKGGSENMSLSDYPAPIATKDTVLVKVQAFGINHAEIYMRKGEWGDTADIIGIECVGIVEEDLTAQYRKGQKVAAMVGGMARSFNGSYAEYIAIPKNNLIPFESTLPWDQLAAIPESYATAWALLHWCLEIQEGETLLIRGGTSTVGMAGIILASQMGMKVIATTRSQTRSAFLQQLGANAVIIDDGVISSPVRSTCPDGVDKVMDLVGNSVLTDSLSCIRPRGILAVGGLLGGLSPIESFQPIFQIPNGIRLTTLASAFAFGQKGFEFSQIPLQRIINDIEEGRIQNILRHTFPIEKIGEAHRLVEQSDANGKVVIQW